jgi:hypothetical protein
MGIKLFDGFKEVLIDMALSNWEDLIAPHLQMLIRQLLVLNNLYKKCIANMLELKLKGDTQIEYYKTLWKPIKSNPLNHASQMLTLACFGNKLPGIKPPLTEIQVKKCIFHYFPWLHLLHQN